MSAGGVEGGIILVQAALELLGWTQLVEETKSLSGQGYEKLAAADKLRLLLSSCSIPLSIPATQTELVSAAKTYGWTDGPQATTEIRNALVHSNPTKRKKVLSVDPALTYEAYEVSLWFLELILLRFFDYRANYSCRVSAARWRVEAVQVVPWA
jgi:hypothetical protein